MMCGMFAGLVHSFVLSPIELVKCRLQIQKETSKKAYYKGSFDCVSRILQEEGLRNGLFKGMFATILREVPCYMGQFGSYTVAKHSIAKARGHNDTK